MGSCSQVMAHFLGFFLLGFVVGLFFFFWRGERVLVFCCLFVFNMAFDWFMSTSEQFFPGYPTHLAEHGSC